LVLKILASLRMLAVVGERDDIGRPAIFDLPQQAANGYLATYLGTYLPLSSTYNGIGIHGRSLSPNIPTLALHLHEWKIHRSKKLCQKSFLVSLRSRW
jgi:hypothetical protein